MRHHCLFEALELTDAPTNRQRLARTEETTLRCNDLAESPFVNAFTPSFVK